MTPHDPNFKINANVPCFYKRKSEWRKIIDSTWGPGLPLAQKLQVFDYYSNYVRAWNPTFCYTHLNWDSVSAYWRAQITDSTSLGRFTSILGYLARELKDGHAFAWDNVMTTTPLNPGTPILVDLSCDGQYGVGAVSHFGAGLTALPDSSLLVYMVVPNHPLGLEPGDIVLGYEGIPWKNLIRELLAAEIPLVGRTGSSPSSYEECLLYCAGQNWHLFDTIDVVKYKTGQTVHLSTDGMITLNPAGGLVNGAQLPVPGVPMPTWVVSPVGVSSPAVSYGIVQGTNIGYIYVYHEFNDVQTEFEKALVALAQTRGLIIDTRFNIGGQHLFNNQIARLTSYAGPTLETLERSSPLDLFSLVFSDTIWENFFVPQDNMSYQHPVAVLLGPASRSCGDGFPWQLRYLDDVRFFGKSSWAIFTGYNNLPESPVGSFSLYAPDFLTVDQNSPNTQLWGKEFPIDERVWLTPDGVAKGVDDVVQRAVQWITTLTYAHDAALDRHYARPGVDSVLITTVLANPLQHSAALSAIVTDTLSIVRDSVPLYNDGLHGDGIAGDSIWGCRVRAPSDRGVFLVSIRTDDLTQGSFRRLPKEAAFATTGPLSLDSVAYAKGTLSYNITPYIKNNATDSTVRGASVILVCNDPWAGVSPPSYPLSDIAPGGRVSSGTFVVRYNARTFPGYFRLVFQLAINGYVVWTDSVRLAVTGVAEARTFPTKYALEQNYPNPFNPSTTIRYELPKSSMVRLSAYDILGREVTVLVNERKIAGSYEVKFDASRLASGVYFYRLTAGQFVQTRKMIVVK